MIIHGKIRDESNNWVPKEKNRKPRIIILIQKSSRLMVPKKEKNMLKKFSDEDEDLDEVWKVPAYDDVVALPVLEKNEVLSAFLATPG